MLSNLYLHLNDSGGTNLARRRLCCLWDMRGPVKIDGGKNCSKAFCQACQIPPSLAPENQDEAKVLGLALRLGLFSFRRGELRPRTVVMPLS